MGKLLILSLEESEHNLSSKIMEIVNEAGISTDKIIDQEQRAISIGELTILPTQRKVLKRNKEVSLTNIEFRILYALALHQSNILSKAYFTENVSSNLIRKEHYALCFTVGRIFFVFPIPKYINLC